MAGGQTTPVAADLTVEKEALCTGLTFSLAAVCADVAVTAQPEPVDEVSLWTSVMMVLQAQKKRSLSRLAMHPCDHTTPMIQRTDGLWELEHVRSLPDYIAGFRLPPDAFGAIQSVALSSLNLRL